MIHDNDTGQGFRASLDGINAIYVPSSSLHDIETSLQASLTLLRSAGKGARLFIVRTHLGEIESTRWNDAFGAVGVHPRADLVGAESLLIVNPSRPRRR